MDKTLIGRREEKAREVSIQSLTNGDVVGILGLRRVEEHVEPYLFTTVEELRDLTTSGKYSVVGVAHRLLTKWNEGNLAVVVKGCDERHFIELAKRGNVDLDRVTMIGLACTEDEARECHCVRPYPQEVDAGESIGDVDYLDHEKLRMLVDMSIFDRRRFWTEAFSKCIKCYGCRNACPLCVCEDCRLEESRWVRVGEIPPEFPSFHLIRAFHLADKCVGCGSCENACPMGIPLGQLHQLIREDIKRLFGYEAGRDVFEESPLLNDFENLPMGATVDEL
jgi:formate dehydrogenase subunit beta